MSIVEVANILQEENFMPFNKLKLVAMTTTDEEYLCLDEIAERCEVHKRTVERVIEKFRKKLKHWRRRGKTKEYLWSDVLKYAKIHAGIEKENVPSGAIQRAYTKQRINELEAEVERLKNELNVASDRTSSPSCNNQTSVTKLDERKLEERYARS